MSHLGQTLSFLLASESQDVVRGCLHSAACLRDFQKHSGKGSSLCFAYLLSGILLGFLTCYGQLSHQICML